MRKHLKTVLTIFAAVFLVTGVAFGRADVVSPSEAYLGMSYGDWSAAWWQWTTQLPDAKYLYVGDSDGHRCSDYVQTSAPVFFLVGGGDEHKTAVRTCTVPRGKAIFLPIINVECSTLEPAPWHGDNEYALRTCASNWVNPTVLRSLKVVLDGAPLNNLQNTRAQSPVFPFTSLTDTGNLGVKGTGSSVADGYWVLLKPLSPGKHTIHFEAKWPPLSDGTGGNYQNVTYQLTIE
jgi:hypothetical protein